MVHGYIKNSANILNLVLPLCCFIAIFLTLSYWAKISNGASQQEHRQLFNELTITYAIEIEHQIEHTLNPHHLIEMRLKNQKGKLNNIATLTHEILAQHHDIIRISLAPNNTTLVVFPPDNNQHLIGQQITPPPFNEHVTEPSVKFNQPFYSPPIKSDNGSILFSVNNPVYIDEVFWGYVSYQLKVSDIINKTRLAQTVTKKYSYQLSHVSKHHKLTTLAHSETPLDYQIYSAPVKVPENNWLLEISFDNNSTTAFTNFDIFFRLLVTLVITLVIYWTLLEPRRLRQQLTTVTRKLASNNILLQSVLDNINDGVIICNSAGKIYLMNNVARQLYSITENKQLDINASCFQSPDNNNTQAGPSDGLFHKVLYCNEEVEQDIIITSNQGLSTNLKARSKILYDDQQYPTGAMLFVQDITQLKQITHANTSRHIILDMLARDKPIHEIFEHIINDIESNFDNLSGAILLLDNKKTHFIDVVAPQLPTFFTDSLNNVEIRDRVMSCGSAIYLNKMILVEDVQTHPYWINYKDLALQANVRSCWSQPIHSASGELLGSFDIYSNRVNQASPVGVMALKEAATLTALAIERHRDGQWLRKISLAVQHSPNALIIVDNQGIIDYINPKLCQLTGYHSMELIGNSLAVLMPKADNRSLYREVTNTVRMGQDWRGEIKSTKKNGDIYWAYDHVSAIKDKSGKIDKYIIIQEDITENRYRAEQLNYQQNHDLLTGLINTHAFDKQVQSAIKLAKNKLNQHVLCFIDLDHFKKINQQCGQMAGDEFLRQVSAIFRGHLRQRDILARLNADQFAVLMKDCSTESAKRCCNELIQLLANHKFIWQAQNLSISASIGISTIAHTGMSSEEAMKQADMACYLAKLAGGNQTKLYYNNSKQNLPRYANISGVQKIREALDRDKFKLFIQPIIPLSQTQKKISLEILLRLEQDNGELALPQNFLSIAQRYNLAKQLDLWVIEKTLIWFNTNPGILDNIESIAINLTSSSFGDEAQLISIIDLIERHRHIAQYINFEITEYTAVSSLSNSYNFMKKLQKYNINFSLDNFSCGYLSFAYLKDMPINTINIDGHLINELTDNKVSEVMVKSICDVAHSMGIKTVAKSVEHSGLVPKLQQLSIDYIQGYSQGKPVIIDHLTTTPLAIDYNPSKIANPTF